MNWIDTKYLNMKIRMQKFVDEFLNGEQGVAPFVATILLIIIVVGLCAVFWDMINDWFTNTLWPSITKGTKEIGGLGE